MARSAEFALKAFKAISNGALADDDLPSEIKVLDWGTNNICDGSEVTLDDESMKVFNANQSKAGRTEVAIDLNHQTCKESPEYKKFGNKPTIFGYGTPEIRRGDGLYLTKVQWTPTGEEMARDFKDISPAAAIQDGRLIALDSVALTPNGAVNDLHFYSAFSTSATLLDAMTLAGEGNKGHSIAHTDSCMCKRCMDVSVNCMSADDHKSEYGNVDYADTANHRYPIDSEKHVRAAWSYINMPKNQKKYSASEVASIKKRIKAKFSKYGIKSESKMMPYSAVKEPNAYRSTTKYDSLKTSMKDQIDYFRAELGLPDDASDEDVMDGLKAKYHGLVKRQGPLDTPRPGMSTDPAQRGGVTGSGNVMGDGSPHGTITYEAIATLLDSKLKPMSADLESIKQKQATDAATTEQVEKDRIVADASRDGKIIPLSADSIKTTPVAVLREIVTKLPKSQVPVKPIVRPLSADGKPERKTKADAAAAWNETARNVGMRLGTGFGN